MKESFPSPEVEKTVTREEALAAFKKFVDAGVKNPDDLNPADPAVKEANELLDAWHKQEETRTQSDEAQAMRHNLARTMFYVDAGFTDKDYVSEVLEESVVQDAQEARNLKDIAQRDEIRGLFKEAMKKLKAMLKE